MNVVITLVKIESFPQKRADAELILDGSLTGLRLSGFQVIDGLEGLTVWFPSNPYQKGKSTGRFWYLRALEGGDSTMTDRVKAAILTAYQAKLKTGDKPVAKKPAPDKKPDADHAIRAPRAAAPEPTTAAGLSDALAASAALPPAATPDPVTPAVTPQEPPAAPPAPAPVAATAEAARPPKGRQRGAGRPSKALTLSGRAAKKRAKPTSPRLVLARSGR